MQTSQSKILSFDASIAGGVKHQNSSSNKEENSEFLSMVLDAAASKGENLNEKDIKEIVSSVNMSVQQKKANEQPKEIIDAKEILGEDTAGKLFSNATFMQLLQILEMLNGGEKISKFPNFTSRLAKALSNEASIHELKGAKNIHELITIAKKLNLGLEKITITKEQVAELNAKFPNLAKNNFFVQVEPQNPIFNAELKSKVEDVIELTKNTQEPIKLNKLLQEITKNDVGENKNLNVKNEPKEAAKEQKQPAPNIQNVKSEIKNVTSEESAIKNNVTQNVQKELVKNESKATAEILKTDEKSANSSSAKVNLQTLLYPEREQSQTGEQESGSSGENELNSMVKEIMQNARSQSKNLQLVRQTFDNFNTTLKEQVEAYKSPFMRFNITLNPLNLGEVEITMVNRGNNLHINFSSTTQTMNLFLQNQAEFKASLVNMGFTELEMNFSDQNQKKERGNEAYKGTNFNGGEDVETAEQSLLEIVLPRYI